MILKALVELAESQGLTGDLDYQPMPVRWLLTIGPEGQLLGEMADTQRPLPSGRGKPAAAVRSIPNRSKRTTQNEAEFVIDKPEYVFGWFDESEVKGKTENDRLAKLKARAAERHTLYRDEVRLAAERTRDDGLKALALFLERPLPAMPADLGEGDLIGFQYAEGDVGLLTDRPAVRAYWATRRREAERGTGRRPSTPAEGAPPSTAGGVRCLITGELCSPVKLHPKIKGIPPASDTKGGVPLTSINVPSCRAFESYGLSEIACAPVAPNAADAYEKALNHLLADDRRSYRLANNAVVVFWSKGDAGLVDLFSDAVGSGSPDSIRALYASAWKGSPIHLDDISPFYALTLSGAIGRGTVRGWHETTLGVVLNNLRCYFEDIDIVRKEGEPRPLIGNQRFPGMLNLLSLQNKEENIPPGLAADIFAAVLTGTVFPRTVLSSAVQRVRSEHNEDNIRFHEHKRFALLKAYLRRARRAGQFERSLPEIWPMLDEACLDPAYRLGRLFAVLEKIQENAIGAGANIRDRYYGAASATPIVVFPQLMRKLPHHLAKIDASTYFERIIQQICDGLQPPTPFPPVLKLEEQGLFAVGYYHQRQALFTKRERPPTETAETQPH